MYRIISRLTVVLVLFVSSYSTRAFSLLGNLETWMTPSIGYSLNGELGGPMALGYEYRWEVPTVVYAYDQTFLNFFGTNGVNAVDAAIKILNDLPPASKTKPDLSDIPLDTLRVNPTAQTLGLLDVKSTALHFLLEELGLTTPDVYVWTLRLRYYTNPGPIANYYVIQRNYDPISLLASSYINGTLYTYTVQEPIDNANNSSTFPVVSPNDSSFFPRVPVAGISGLALPGLFFVGLTRDDVGGLRYLLGTKNYNVENRPPNTTVIGGGTVSSGPVNLSQVFLPVGATNVGGGGTGTGGAANPVNTALRPGRDKVRFIRSGYDSLLGQGFQSVTNNYTDTYVQNSALFSQQVRRAINTPDILFMASDLGFNNNSPFLLRRTDGKVNNGALNGTGNNIGPGVIRGPIQIAFTTTFPLRLQTPAGVGEFDPVTLYGAWGSFDGSDTPPVVYPVGASIIDLENLVLQGQQ